MEARLYISEQAIKLKGTEYFRGITADALMRHIGNTVDELIITIDDMNNVYVSAEENENYFTDSEDLFE